MTARETRERPCPVCTRMLVVPMIDRHLLWCACGEPLVTRYEVRGPRNYRLQLVTAEHEVDACVIVDPQTLSADQIDALCRPPLDAGPALAAFDAASATHEHTQVGIGITRRRPARAPTAPTLAALYPEDR